MNLNKIKNKILFYYEKFLRKFVPVKFYSFFIKRKKPEILVRVDDFPHWKKSFNEFLEFDKIMEEYSIPYVLGVTPFLSKNPLNPENKKFRKLNKEEIEFLKKAQEEGKIKIAMHGITHQTTKKEVFSEFKGKSPEKISKETEKAKEYMKKQGLKTEIIIPPFNEISKENFHVLKKHFNAITGGPETVKDLGKKRVSKIDNTYYLPTYFPYYYHPKKQSIPPLKGKIILTLHWSWFDKKEEIEKLAKYIKHYCTIYEKFIKDIK